MEIIGFLLGILIGVSLGLIGSGGSILSIPILVYLMHIPPSIATTYSLFIVGVSALVGSVKGAKDKLLDYKMALFFALPSVVAIYIMRKFLLPLLPNVFFKIAEFTVTKDFFIMLVFAILMILSSVAMIKKSNSKTNASATLGTNKIIVNGVFIGLLTGFVGVGGGFLIIPTLTISAKLPIKKAVATSLVIIAANALIGFLGSTNKNAIAWDFLLGFTGFAVCGIFLGIFLSKKINNQKLKLGFGWFVLVTGIYIIIKEIFFSSLV